MNKWTERLIWAVLVMTLGAMFTAAYLVWFQDNPPARASLFEIEGDTFRPGDAVPFSVDEVCRFTDAPSTVYITYLATIPDRYYPLAPMESSGRKEHDCESRSGEFFLPDDLLPGEDYIRFARVVFHLKFADRILETSTDSFAVLPLE